MGWDDLIDKPKKPAKSQPSSASGGGWDALISGETPPKAKTDNSDPLEQVLGGKGTPTEKYMKGMAPVREITQPLMQLLTRGQSGSAALAEGIVSKRGVKQTLKQTGEALVPFKGKTYSYQDILDEHAKPIPAPIRTILGFVLDVGLDPTTYLSLGGTTAGKLTMKEKGAVDAAKAILEHPGAKPGAKKVAAEYLQKKAEKVTPSQKVISMGGKSLLPEKANAEVLRASRGAVEAARNTKLGQWVTKHFSAQGKISDDKFYQLYRKYESQGEYEMNRVAEDAKPAAQELRDLSKKTGISKEKIGNFAEQPKVRGEKVSGLVQQRLPLEGGGMMTPPPQFPGENITSSHKVVKGETLSEIAERYGVDTNQLAKVNRIKNPDRVKAGTELTIPHGEQQALPLNQSHIPVTVDKQIPVRIPPDPPVKPGAPETSVNLGDTVSRDGRDYVYKDFNDTEATLYDPETADEIVVPRQELEAEHPPEVPLEPGDPVNVEGTDYVFNGHEDPHTVSLLNPETGESVSVPRESVMQSVSPTPEPAPTEAPMVSQMDLFGGEDAPVTNTVSETELQPADPPPQPGFDPAEWDDEGMPIEGEYDFDSMKSNMGEYLRDKNLPDDVRTELEGFVERLQGRGDTRIERENYHGIDTKPLESDLVSYMYHSMTPEAMDALRNSKAHIGSLPERYRSMLGTQVEMPPRPRHQIDMSVTHKGMAKRALPDMSIEEINEAGMHGKVIDGYNGKILEDDPVLVNSLRDLISERAVNASKFIREAASNPDWAISEGFPGESKINSSLYRRLDAEATRRYGKLVKGKLFRTDIADALDQYMTRTFDPEYLDPALKSIDKIQSMWKQYTLGLSPSWFMNNMVGNFWNGVVLAGASGKSIVHGLLVTMTNPRANALEAVGGETIARIAETLDQDPKLLARINGVDLHEPLPEGRPVFFPEGKVPGVPGMSMTELQLLAERTGVAYKGLWGIESKRVLRDALEKGTTSSEDNLPPIVRESFKANQVIEQAYRMGLFIDGLQKGMHPDQAAIRVKKFLFDYGELSPTEKSVMKRLSPFYAWTRKNVPLQIEQLFKQPGKQAMLPKAIEALEDDKEREPDAVKPDWLTRGTYAQVGNPGGPGTARFINMSGNPLADLNNATNSPGMFVLGQLGLNNPIISAILDGIGFDSQQGRMVDSGEKSTLARVGGHDVVVNARLANVLNDLLPPAQQASKISAPRHMTGLPQNKMVDQLLKALLGIKTYDRSIPMDTVSTINGAKRGINDAKGRMRRAITQGMPGEQDAYMDQIKQLLEGLSTTAEAIRK